MPRLVHLLLAAALVTPFAAGPALAASYSPSWDPAAVAAQCNQAAAALNYTWGNQVYLMYQGYNQGTPSGALGGTFALANNTDGSATFDAASLEAAVQLSRLDFTGCCAFDQFTAGGNKYRCAEGTVFPVTPAAVMLEVANITVGWAPADAAARCNRVGAANGWNWKGQNYAMYQAYDGMSTAGALSGIFALANTSEGTAVFDPSPLAAAVNLTRVDFFACCAFDEFTGGNKFRCAENTTFPVFPAVVAFDVSGSSPATSSAGQASTTAGQATTASAQASTSSAPASASTTSAGAATTTGAPASSTTSRPSSAGRSVAAGAVGMMAIAAAVLLA